MPFLAWTRKISLSTIYETAAAEVQQNERVTGDENACSYTEGVPLAAGAIYLAVRDSIKNDRRFIAESEPRCSG